jgi:hypothetical protein
VGEPVQRNGLTVTPLAQSLRVRLPFGPAGWGFVWNRPAAVLVEQNGRVERLPIVDVTRLAQIGLLAALFVVARLTRRRRRKA